MRTSRQVNETRCLTEALRQQLNSCSYKEPNSRAQDCLTANLLGTRLSSVNRDSCV